MALHLATRHPDQFAGVIALSCYLPLAREFAKLRSTANQAHTHLSWPMALRTRGPVPDGR